MVLKYNKIIIITMMAGYMLSICNMYALTTFINDKGKRIIIYNEEDKTLIPIGRNEKRRFGNQHEHAHFTIYYMQQANKPSGRIYTCKQNLCGGNGNIQLKLSDIKKGTEVTDLFTIIKHEPHSSMVNELPIMKK